MVARDPTRKVFFMCSQEIGTCKGIYPVVIISVAMTQATKLVYVFFCLAGILGGTCRLFWDWRAGLNGPMQGPCLIADH